LTCCCGFGGIRKHFFFEKKKQKTFDYWSMAFATGETKYAKVFWFFFSKKNIFLMPGALNGIRIIEFAGIGPGPFCGMMLADHGAEVIRIERPGQALRGTDPLLRSRRSIVIDMKNPGALALIRALCRTADGIIEGYRPGVMERLGLGPEVLLGDNAKLVYGRMTGWGQTGPLAHTAGHDINYIAISGTLHTVGRRGETPVPPVNYLGDFGGGGMMLAFGMVSALLAVRMGAPGQIVDAAMTEGSALLASMTWGYFADGAWTDEPGANLLDGAAHFYDTYRCADGRFVAVGAIEGPFYAVLREKLGLAADPAFDAQMNKAAWPALKARMAEIIATRTRDEWAAIFEGTDGCVAPVLSLVEAAQHPHNASRQSFVDVGGTPQPGPSPRLSVTAARRPQPPGRAGQDTDELLESLGYNREAIAQLRSEAVVA
jgi:alpha-methylacyl-CoA racemase